MFNMMHADKSAIAKKPGHTCQFYELFSALNIFRLTKCLSGGKAVNLEFAEVCNKVLEDVRKANTKARRDSVVVTAEIASAAAEARGRKRVRLAGSPGPLMLMPPSGSMLSSVQPITAATGHVAASSSAVSGASVGVRPPTEAACGAKTGSDEEAEEAEPAGEACEENEKKSDTEEES
jgi:hypothetical protein